VLTCHLCSTSWNSSAPDGCVFLEFCFIGKGVLLKMYRENWSLIGIKITGTLQDNVHEFRLILFTNITMVASVAKFNSVCVAAMVTDGTSDFLVMMVTLITKLPVLQWLPLPSCYPGCWLPWLCESTTCVLFVIFPYLHILTLRENDQNKEWYIPKY